MVFRLFDTRKSKTVCVDVCIGEHMHWARESVRVCVCVCVCAGLRNSVRA